MSELRGRVGNDWILLNCSTCCARCRLRVPRRRQRAARPTGMHAPAIRPPNAPAASPAKVAEAWILVGSFECQLSPCGCNEGARQPPTRRVRQQRHLEMDWLSSRSHEAAVQPFQMEQCTMSAGYTQ